MVAKVPMSAGKQGRQEDAETVTCPHCRYEKPAAARRCPHCGYPWSWLDDTHPIQEK